VYISFTSPTSLRDGWPQPLCHLLMKKWKKTRAKNVLPNINRMQATAIIPRQRLNDPICCCVTLSVASAFHSVSAGSDGSTQHVFCPWWPWPLTLTFKLVRVREQTRLPCEFGTNPFSGSRDIWFTNKIKKQKVTDSTKNRTLRSLLRVVIKRKAVTTGYKTSP